MNEQFYLPLAYLNAWEYCPRRFFLEYELGENADNEHIIIGRHLHRNVDDEGKSVEGDKVVYRHQWVWSDRTLINGIIDAVEEKDNQLVPLEFKKGRMANHLNDHFQLCGAAMCLEERTGTTIPYGEIFYYANRRRERIYFTPELRLATEQAIQAARSAIGSAMPPPIDNAKKCQDCSLQKICLPKEIKKLRLEV
ncbi:CRISPR-associated protein Cas4 [Scytonema sp. UIC 10036]|uniref:CRISPR-associated protein Cas4 n=1 Tax=Scytonema sp. UIC 10036 TaxID=2304196 RepID=UPI0012DA89A3|nr:CRISPR-associated protein Cas4 [Scytonema sp. UIC 10036]MUH00303.1 CRISPR-associated protein Cas4 [Scytonema sp. UIC 10036]